MAVGAAVAGYFAAEGAAAAIIAGAVNGAIVGAAVGAVSAAVNGTNILEGMGKGALTGAATGAIAGGISNAFNAAGGTAVPEGTNVSQVGTGTEAGKQALAAPAPVVEPGVAGAAPPPTTAPVIAQPAAPTAAVAAPAVPTDSQYLLAIEKMGKEAFYREAASGAVQAGVGAYAAKEEAKSAAEVAAEERALKLRAGGVLEREYAAPVVSPEYAAVRPTVTAPIAARPTAVQVGVERPTADIRNISVQRGVLPNA